MAGCVHRPGRKLAGATPRPDRSSTERSPPRQRRRAPSHPRCRTCRTTAGSLRDAAVVVGAVAMPRRALAWITGRGVTARALLDQRLARRAAELPKRYPGRTELYGRISNHIGMTFVRVLRGSSPPDSWTRAPLDHVCCFLRDRLQVCGAAELEKWHPACIALYWRRGSATATRRAPPNSSLIVGRAPVGITASPAPRSSAAAAGSPAATPSVCACRLPGLQPLLSHLVPTSTTACFRSHALAVLPSGPGRGAQ